MPQITCNDVPSILNAYEQFCLWQGWDTRWWEFKCEFQLQAGLGRASSGHRHADRIHNFQAYFLDEEDNKGFLKGGSSYLFWSEATCITQCFYDVEPAENTYRGCNCHSSSLSHACPFPGCVLYRECLRRLKMEMGDIRVKLTIKKTFK